MSKKIQGEDGKIYVEKKPFYKKWWFILIAVLIVFGAIGNLGKKNETSSSEKTQTTQSKKEDKKEEIVYEKISAKQLISNLGENALKAKEVYKDMHVEITGQLGNIDSNGKYISIDPIGEDFVLTGIQAYVKSDEQKEAILEFSKGQKITVKGKIKNVGEIMGYSVDIDEIFATQTK